MTLRLVQLGLGGWGRNWVEEVTRATPGVEPVAWVDPDPARARAGDRRARPAAGARLRRARGGAGAPSAADAALVAVPLAVHAAATRQALEAGLHVLVEKPFTDDARRGAGPGRAGARARGAC